MKLHKSLQDEFEIKIFKQMKEDSNWLKRESRKHQREYEISQIEMIIRKISHYELNEAIINCYDLLDNIRTVELNDESWD